MRVSKRRAEMGEEKWAEYQQKRNTRKATKYKSTERGKKVSFAVKETRRKIKLRLIEYKGGKCERCGYDKCSAALDFHHKDPEQKEFGLGRANLSFEKQKAEVDKCELLCANCHRELHYKEDMAKVEVDRELLFGGIV